MGLDADIEVGSPVEIADNVHRITAPNPSAMTGPGTNTYVIGKAGEYAVVDPGPLIDSHIEAIKRFTSDGLKWIIVTHTHSDHSPAASVLKSDTGAPCYGMASVGDHELQFQDATFKADHVLADGDAIEIGGEILRTLYTPGHVSNHLCFLLKSSGLLFSGDHIMQGSTVAIVPPQGNMKDYLASLEKLLSEPVKAIAPAHGLVIKEPEVEVRKLIEHRMWRETKVIENLGHQPVSIEKLTPVVYDDVPESMHWAAKFSLYAHLQKLFEEGRATRSKDVVLDSHEAIKQLDQVEWSLL